VLSTYTFPLGARFVISSLIRLQVRNAEARKGGLDVSLFKLLSESHPDAVVDLSHQYRMNEDIMLLSNELIYEGRLKCGTEAVAKQGLVLPHRKKCQDMYHGAICGARDESCWVQDLLEEK
jgi:DNA replication ATP-dependent helicase Dna2